MFDDLRETFERDRRMHGTQRRGGIRGLIARLTGDDLGARDDRDRDHDRRSDRGRGHYSDRARSNGRPRRDVDLRD